jgi:hypothetical protein
MQGIACQTVVLLAGVLPWICIDSSLVQMLLLLLLLLYFVHCTVATVPCCALC